MCSGSSYWGRTSDLLDVSQALVPTELSYYVEKVGLEPTTFRMQI
jgi:hypothetical protein